MATKSKAAAEKETVEKIPAEEEILTGKAPEMPADPWQEEMEVIVPRKPKGEDQQYYVCVNDRRFMIPADGKMQKMPKPIAEVLLASIESDAQADDFADKITKDSASAAVGL